MSYLALPADAIRAWLDTVLDDVLSAAPDLHQDIHELKARVAEPPTFLVTGAGSTGKSTLINAIVGQPVAPVSLIGDTRGRHAYAASDLPAPTSLPHTYEVHRSLAPTLLNMTLVDTGTDEPRRDPEFVAGADAVVHLIDRPTPVINHIPSFGPADTLLVVSRADEFGAGSLGSDDPVVDAAEYAENSRDDCLAAVHVSPLLASATSAVNDDIAAALPGMSRDEIIQAAAEGSTPSAVQVIGTYGVLHGGAAASAGAQSLQSWMTRVSGVDRLRQELLGNLSQAALLRRGHGVLEQLESLRQQASDPSAVTDALSAHRGAPAAWRIRLFPHVERLWAAGFPEDSRFVLRTMLADDSHDLAGVPSHASPGQVLDGLREELRTVNTRLQEFTTPVTEVAFTAVAAVLRNAVTEITAQ